MDPVQILRANMAAFGMDLDHMTNAEVQAGLTRLTEIFRHLGPSAPDAIQAMTDLARGMTRPQHQQNPSSPTLP
jgi:hypothetical protein